MALGVNLQQPAYFSWEQPFVNLLLGGASSNGGAWFCSTNCATPTYDAQGYPESLGTNTYIALTYLANFPFSGHYYLIKYSGDGVHPIADAGTIAINCSGNGSGTIVDSTPGRLVVHQTTGAGEGRLCETAIDPNSTGNYIRNIAVIDCGASGSPCANGNEALWTNCPYVQQSCLNPAWETDFGTSHVGGPGFTSYRYMDWMNTNAVSDGNFADRSTRYWYSWATLTRQVTGVPLEGIASVMNQTCADGWINVPAVASKIVTDATATGMSLSGGTLTVSGLVGTIQPGDYINSSFSATASVVGTTLTVSAVGSGYLAVGSFINGGPGAGSSIIAQTAGTTGGIGTYTLSSSFSSSSGTITGPNISYGAAIASGSGSAYVIENNSGSSTVASVTNSITFNHIDTSYIQSMATVMQQNIVWCNGNQKLRIEGAGNEPWNFTTYGFSYFAGLAQSLWGTTSASRGGSYNYVGMIAAITGQIFKSTFGSASGHIEAIIGTQGVTDTFYATDGNYLVTTPYWIGGPAYSNGANAMAVSEYYGFGEYSIPSDWLSLPDGGVNNLYLELTGHDLVNNQITNASSSITNAGGTGYVNGTYGYVPLTGGSGTGARCLFTVSSGVPTCAISSNQGNGGENYQVGDVLGVSNANLGGSGSGWAGTVTSVTGTDTSTNQITNAAMLTTAWQNYTATYNLKFYVYEGGEQITLNNGTSPMLTLLCAWDGYTGAQGFTTGYLQQWRTIMGNQAPFHYYTDTSPCVYPSSWGLKYYPGQSAPPKYLGAARQLNFLLNRDLPGHPVNDDRPVGLNAAA